MKHYIDTTGTIFAYEEDGSQDHLIGDKTPIDNSELATLVAQKQKEQFDALSYQEKRRFEYPPFTDYLDGVVKGDQAQIQTYIAACLAVKAKYPKS
jgi:hypothetical protein